MFMKAYDFNEYLKASKENFAKQGINLAEDVLEAVVKAQYYTTKSWLVESAKLTDTPFDDLVMTQLAIFDKSVEGLNIDLNKDGV